ncbi:MAG: FKBP-type peptidyl-prolyl cis-trans isomerase [Chlamydiia bacterium]|nr:FKBP-type peptidyl-prolyl cis-trans isomerase [Chlamydiia bacterium]
MLSRKNLLLTLTALSLSSSSLFADTNSNDQDIDISKLSEAFGHFIGKNLNTSGLNFDIDQLVKGIKDGAAGKPAPMSEQEYQKGMMELQQRTLKKLAEDNLSAANKFIEENKNKPGVEVLENDKLQYKVLQTGSGEAVKEHSAPKLNYKGSYLDGTVFGSSEESGGPISIPLDHTIPGFAQALKGMKEGEKRMIWVHPDLGYGTGGQLAPNSLLIFEVEIIEANPASEDDSQLPLAEMGSDDDDQDFDDDEDLDEDEDDYRDAL